MTRLTFAEYLSARGKVNDKPTVTPTADTGPNPPARDPAQKKNKAKPASVKEYLDGKGKLVDRPSTEIVSDYDGPNPAAPSDGKPYKTPSAAAGKTTGESGLGNMGGKELMYEPNMKQGKSAHLPGGSDAPSWTTKTESFVGATKNMNMREFTEYMLDKVGTITESLPAIKHLAAAGKNQAVVEHLVHEFKREGILANLIEAILHHPESFDIMKDLRKEAVGPPFGMKSAKDAILGDDDGGEESGDMEDGEEEDDMGDMDDEEGDDLNGDMGLDDEEGEEGDEEDMGGEEDEEDPSMGSPNPFMPKKKPRFGPMFGSMGQ